MWGNLENYQFPILNLLVRSANQIIGEGRKLFNAADGDILDAPFFASLSKCKVHLTYEPE
jgi:hypothetical protein